MYIYIYFTSEWKAWDTWQRTVTHDSWVGLTSQHSGSVRRDEWCKRKELEHYPCVHLFISPMSYKIWTDPFVFVRTISTALIHQFCLSGILWLREVCGKCFFGRTCVIKQVHFSKVVCPLVHEIHLCTSSISFSLKSRTFCASTVAIADPENVKPVVVYEQITSIF